MIAILSTVDFDPLGYVELDVRPESAKDDRRRRINRIATLDGGVVFLDGGYTDSDRTITLMWPVRSVAEEALVERMVTLYQRLRLALAGGVYLVAHETYTPGPVESRLTLLVAERLSDI